MRNYFLTTAAHSSFIHFYICLLKLQVYTSHKRKQIHFNTCVLHKFIQFITNIHIQNKAIISMQVSIKKTTDTHCLQMPVIYIHSSILVYLFYFSFFHFSINTFIVVCVQNMLRLQNWNCLKIGVLEVF